MTNKGWWSGEEISSILGLGPEATAVFCARAVLRRDLVRIKRGFYLLPGWLSKTSEDERFKVSALLQTPSYVSLLTALSVHGISTQFPYSGCEAINPIRSIKYEAEGFIFQFVRFPKKIYCGFYNEKSFFIAEPEKAFVDAVYLKSLGRYNLDSAALHLKKLDPRRINFFVKLFPKKTAIFVKQLMEKI